MTDYVTVLYPGTFSVNAPKAQSEEQLSVYCEVCCEPPFHKTWIEPLLVPMACFKLDARGSPGKIPALKKHTGKPGVERVGREN